MAHLPLRPPSESHGTHPEAADVTHLADLVADGPFELTEGDERLATGVRLEDAPGHNPGHHVVWVESGGQSAVVVGHLFLHPAQITRPEIDNGDRDPIVLAETRRNLLRRCALQRSLLIGPLFARPGAGVVVADGETWRLAV